MLPTLGEKMQRHDLACARLAAFTLCDLDPLPPSPRQRISPHTTSPVVLYPLSYM
jgi:hypothetical protein